MNIIEAVSSGKQFRKSTWPFTHHYKGSENMFRLTREEILADDWEIEEPKVEVTREQINKVIWSSSTAFKGFDYFSHDWFEYIYKELGL
jgi:hypothetical protein